MTPENKEETTSGISAGTRTLMDKLEQARTVKLAQADFMGKYNSIDDVLEKKYHLSNIESMDFPDLSRKTEFIVRGVRGNLSKAEGKVLTYSDADRIVEKGMEADLPE
ncbi:MAG: hypothetical protein V4539_00965 [Bacteroidota bacterium]